MDIADAQLRNKKLTDRKEIVTETFHIINSANFDVSIDGISVDHDSCEVIIPESDSANEL